MSIIKKYNILLLFFIFSVGSLISCVSIMQQDYYYNEIILKNKSSDIIRDVLIKVEKTGGIFKCSIIPPQGE